MRSNGLTAPAYTPVADLHPALAEALLDELRLRGIAAYSKPVDRATTAGFDRPDFSTDLSDRLYVDAAAADEAREVIASRDPTLVETNDDLVWAQIVAGYDTPAGTTGVMPWPAFEDLDPVEPDDGSESAAGDSRPAPSTYGDTVPPSGHGNSAIRPDGDSEGSHLPDQFGDLGLEDVSWRRRQDPAEMAESRERYVPPPPPPLPRLRPAEQLAWLGVLGGPVILVLAAILTVPIPTWLELLAALGFVAGFVALVLSMDNRSHDELDGDDGAQV